MKEWRVVKKSDEKASEKSEPSEKFKYFYCFWEIWWESVWEIQEVQVFLRLLKWHQKANANEVLLTAFDYFPISPKQRLLGRYLHLEIEHIFSPLQLFLWCWKKQPSTTPSIPFYIKYLFIIFVNFVQKKQKKTTSYVFLFDANISKVIWRAPEILQWIFKET